MGDTRTRQSSPLQKSLEIARDPSILSLALGLPAQELFPTAEIAEASAAVLRAGDAALQYAMPLDRLKSHVVGLMAARGVHCTEDEVFLTTGAQQALSLLAQLLLGPGQEIWTADAVYPGFRQAVDPFSARLRAIPTDLARGLDVAAAEHMLVQGPRPAFLYVMSTGHNPLACNMPAEAQAELIEFACRHALPLVEDDVYGFLQYDEEVTPPLRSLASVRMYYIGSFSKILAPALRTGWIVAPAAELENLAALKEGSDINIATLSQRIVCQYLDTHPVAARIEFLRAAYHARRDAMDHALRRHLGSVAQWRRPSAGFFFWVAADAFGDTTELLAEAIRRERLAFVPGSAFSTEGGSRYRNALRLNFAQSSCETIAEGVSRLARLLPAARELCAGGTKPPLPRDYAIS